MSKTQDSVKLGAVLRELAAVGCIVDLSVAEVLEENEVEIYQVGGVHDSMVFELPDGRAGYILDLEIVNQSSKTIYCSETELRMPWEDAFFDWLPDPKETGRSFSYFRRKRNGRCERVDAASTSYFFSGGAQLEYPRDLVLNHILLKGCALPPRCPLKGLLLACGGPMPHDLRHGQWLEPTLALIASNHREYTAQIQLWTAWRSTKKGPQERPIFIEPHLDSRSALRLVLAISTVRPTLRNREVWTRTGTGESRSEASHRQVCGRQRSPCHGGMLTEMGWGKGKCPLPQRPIPENNTWSFAQNSGHT